MDNSEGKHSRTKYLQILLVFGLTLFVISIYLRPLIFSPLENIYTIGGDGLTIHYNLQYHATWGEGAHLTSQFYPKGESIFMTDAQGVLGVLFAYLRPYAPDIAQYSVAWSNILIYWSNCLAAIVLFLCFLKLKMEWRYAVGFSVLISLLSPQIYRQTCGHYALGYAFILPLVIYFLLHRKVSIKLFATGTIMVAVLVILGLNNPYLLAISGSMILSAAGVAVLAKGLKLGFSKDLSFSVIGSWLGFLFVALGITFYIIHLTDFVTDRVEVPWGFFVHHASPKGLFFPDHTWLGDGLTSLFKMRPNSSESWSYIGLVSVLTLLAAPILLWKKTIKAALPSQIVLLFFAGLVVLVFAFGLPFSLFREWSTEHLGVILQFRAPARFSWVFYYATTIMCSFFLYHLHLKLKEKSKSRATILLICGLSLWCIDIHQFLSFRKSDAIFDNPFRDAKLAPIADLCQNLGIDQSNYHGIYLLPTEQGWTDKVLQNGEWRSNYEGYRYSLASGLPLINGKLSRMSLSQTLKSLEINNHELIKPVLFSELDSSKDLLFLTANRFNPKVIYPIDTIYTNEYISLLKMDITVANTFIDNAIESKEAQADQDSSYYSYHHFDQGNGPSFAGTNGVLFQDDEAPILELPLDAFENDSIHVSFWYYPDTKIPGAPHFDFKVLDANGATIDSTGVMSLNQKITQKGWLFTAASLKKTLNSSLQISHVFSNDLYIDEILIRAPNSHIRHTIGDLTLINNVFVYPH